MIFEKLFGKKSKSPSTEKDNTEVPTNDVVAIAMALHLYYGEVHDDESNVITIKRIERRYSPWSSKIYGVNNNIR
jgi:glutaconyl-CoA/methylmalonyl-CoA decarboxylase subunit delta